ncbi:MAG: hypothetical protein J6125_02425, partial [Clostridia bacterium]|nr:hypothetical protein [Clostridia bacterium]
TLRIPVPETDAADAAQAADKAAPDPTSETEIDKKEKEPPADGSDAPTDEARSDADRPGEATADGAKADGDTTARDDRETADDEGTGAFGLSTGAALLSRDGCELYGERMLIGCRRYVTVDLPLDGMTSEAEVEGAIREIVRQGEYGKETSLLVRFGGHTSPDFLPRTPGDKTTYGLAELVCVDLSLPDSDENGYARDMSVRGEMVRAFAPALADDDPDKKEIAAEALRIAFAALDNKDISHL